MKFSAFFIILLIVGNECSRVDHIYSIFSASKGFIFQQMRSHKANLNDKLKNVLERNVKELELKYLLDKDKFVEHLEDLHYSFIEFEKSDHHKLSVKEMEEDLILFLENFKNLNDYSKERKEIIEYIDSLDVMTKESFNQFFDFHEKSSKKETLSILNLIESIPKLVINKDSNTNNIVNSNVDEEHKASKHFKNFVEDLHSEFNFDEIHAESNYHKKQEKIKNVIKNIKNEHKSSFSSFFQEYLSEKLVNNDRFKLQYTNEILKKDDLNLEKLNLLKEKYSNYRFKNVDNNNNENNDDKSNTKTDNDQNNKANNDTSQEKKATGDSSDSLLNKSSISAKKNANKSNKGLQGAMNKINAQDLETQIKKNLFKIENIDEANCSEKTKILDGKILFLKLFLNLYRYNYKGISRNKS